MIHVIRVYAFFILCGLFVVALALLAKVVVGGIFGVLLVV
jgi:hypothetical protein